MLESRDAKKIASALESDEECINHVERQTRCSATVVGKGVTWLANVGSTIINVIAVVNWGTCKQ